MPEIFLDYRYTSPLYPTGGGQIVTAPARCDNSENDEGRPSNTKDKGCEYAASCLNCPFPDCLQGKGEAAKLIRAKRNKGIRELFKKGYSRQEIADRLGVSLCTVRHVLRGGEI